MEAEEYQHVKEPQKSDKLTLDNATEEQSKKIHPDEEMENNDNDEPEADDNLNELNKETEEEELQNKDDIEEMSAEKLGKKSDKPCKNEESKDDTNIEEHMEVEGEIVETMTVQRSNDTTAHCK